MRFGRQANARHRCDPDLTYRPVFRIFPELAPRKRDLMGLGGQYGLGCSNLAGIEATKTRKQLISKVTFSCLKDRHLAAYR